MRRSAGTPIAGAGGTLIPVYTFGGRSAGGDVLTTADLGLVIRRLTSINPDNTHQARDVAFDAFSDLSARVLARGFGSSRTAFFQDFDDRLDRRQRLSAQVAIDRMAAVATAALPVPARFLVPPGPAGLAEFVIRVVPELEPAAAAVPIYRRTGERFVFDARLTLPWPQLVCTRLTAAARSRLSDDHRALVDAQLDDAATLQALGAVTGTSLSATLQALASANLDALAAAAGQLRNVAIAALRVVSARSSALRDAAASLALQNATLAANLALCATNPFDWRILEGRRTFDRMPRVVATTAVDDDEIDSDGPVGYDSAMGLFLATTDVLAFDHSRGGAWYRRFDSPFEPHSHNQGKTLYDNGRHLATTIIATGGPVPRTDGTLAAWPDSF
jgi:hypothetical protein